MSSSKKVTCKGTLRQVFIRVYRLVIHSVMLVFSTQLRELLPLLTFSLVSSTPPPTIPCVNEYTVYTVQCARGGYVVIGGEGPQTDKHLKQSPFTSNYF
jgi:hypothetical protein